MERTSDFIRIVQLFQKKTDSEKLQESLIPKNKIRHRSLGDMTRKAEKLSDQVNQCDKLVNQLQALVNQKLSVLKDPTHEISEISIVFKKKIQQTIEDISQFQQLVTSNSNRNMRSHFMIVVKSLKSRVSKNATRFENGLKVRADILKEQSSRRSMFSHTGKKPMVCLDSPLFTPPPPPQLRSTQMNNTTNSDFFPSKARSNQSVPNIPLPPQQGVGLRRRGNDPFSNPNQFQHFNSQQDSQYNPQLSVQTHHPGDFAQDRLNNATQIESSIVELSGMFSRMAAMVSEQGEIVSRIDDDMEATQMNVEDAQSELLKFFNTMSGNRSLIIKIFLVLLFFIFLFVVVF